MSSEVQITLTAVDEASAVINQVAGTMDSATGEINTSTKSMTSGFSNASNSVKDNALAFNNLATAGAGLYMSFERVENAQVMVDRANLTLHRSTEALEKAQTAYNDAVARYGPNSTQAKDALDKLNIAQEAHQVALERADMAARNMNNTMLMSTLTVIPSVITMVTTVIPMIGGFSGAIEGLSGAMTFLAANPIVLIIVGIAALVAGLIYAYNNCAPFRDAINTIAAVLGGAFSAAINGVIGALTWFWQNVLVPVGNFLVGSFGAAVKTVSDILNFLWNSVLVPFGSFLNSVFKPVIDGITGVFQHFYDIIKPIVDAVNTISNAMGGVVSAIGGALGSAGSAISNFIGGICFAHALQTAADSSAKTMSSWTDMVSNSMSKGLNAIKDFNKQAGLDLAPGTPGGATAPLSAAAIAGAKPPVTIHVMAPLVNIEGSADKATADLAAQQVMKTLQSIIVEPTSTGAAATQKRIRKGSILQ